ncbi:E3 SUMO-protein ligase PIAS2 isoform X3 [Nothobranchius furzeri]|uniref:E3 SUMO-protein ligase PIAS2 isoform X3 n=1 Tax=Nothobranchius furzeri TaxID=105023 RepID=UPI0039048FF5
MNLQQPASLVPPVHPDVQMKPLPFYDVLDVLIKPSSLGASTVQRYHQEKYFIFALTPQQVREVCISRDFLPCGRRDYMVQIQLRFCLSETSCPQEDNYPNSLCVKVNGKLFPLPTYSMSVYLVRQLTSPLLLQRLRMKGIRNPDHSRALIKEKLTADPDSEIATTSLRVSLMCPLGKMRLTVPCRAVTCSHLQCFDAALYLQMNEKKPSWICPVCDKKAAYENLIIDGLFLEILNDCSDVDEIKFQEDGTWCPMRPKKDTVSLSSQSSAKIEATALLRHLSVVPISTEPSSTKKADVIDLTVESSSSSDEEKDSEPPLKKQCVYTAKKEELHTKGVLSYQPSMHVPSIQTLEQSCLTSSLADYTMPFHPSNLATIPADMQSIDLFSLIQSNSQHYRPQMFLDNLTGRMQSAATASTSSTSLSSTSHYDASRHAADSIHEARVITGERVTDGSISDIISLD